MMIEPQASKNGFPELVIAAENEAEWRQLDRIADRLQAIGVDELGSEGFDYEDVGARQDQLRRRIVIRVHIFGFPENKI